MSRIKRILSMVLVCIMTLALVPVTTPTVSAAATGTTALFNGNATYLLQERFATLADLDGDATKVLSGWDVDYRGGDITYDGGAIITDSNSYERISMSHQLMKHEGALVMESVFSFISPVDEGFYYEMSGNGNSALRISLLDKGNYVDRLRVYNFAVNGVDTGIRATHENAKEYHVRAEFTGSTVTVWINGEVAAKDVAYSQKTLDNIEIGTGITGVGKIRIKNVDVYVNYAVNESFLGKLGNWWNTVRGNVVTVPGAPYVTDTYGLALDSVEEAEPDYSVNKPRVIVSAETADDITFQGSAIKVSDSTEVIGGRKNVVKVENAGGNGGATTNAVGVILDGDSFAFEEDDIITYSYDVYLEGSDTYVRAWIRDEKDYSPVIINETSIHAAYKGKWTTVTNTVTYADLINASETGWTTPGKFALTLRPGVNQTIYLDNIYVTVGKTNYLSNAATGTRVEWKKSMNAWDNDVMYGSGVTSFEYVADPKGEKNSNVLRAEIPSSGINNVIVIKARDNFGMPIAAPKVGDIVDVSFDFYSSVAQNSTEDNNVALRIGNRTFTNGSDGPANGAHDMGKINGVAKETWTTIKKSFTVSTALAPTIDQDLYIIIRVPVGGKIYIDDLKFAIRNPEDDVLGDVWEAQKASDITWTGASSAAKVSDESDPSSEGRGTVIKATGFNTNSGNVGFVLGDSYQFKAGDIISYSVDVYTTESNIKPNVWIRSATNDPYHTFTNVAPTTGKWTTYRESISYEQLLTSSTSADKTWNQAKKYCVYIRIDGGSTSSVLYLDNFKVTVHNPNTQGIDIVTGEDVVAGGKNIKVSEYTISNSGNVTGGHTIGGKSNVVKVTPNTSSNAYANRAGINVGPSNFAFKKGDVLEYSITIYPTAEHALTAGPGDMYKVVLRNGASGAPWRNIAPAKTLIANEWNTITNRISFDDLSAYVNNSSGATWATEGQYVVYLGLPVEYYVSDFEVKVFRPEYAFGEPPSNASLEKRFESALTGAQTLEFDVFVPSTGANGFSATLGGATFKIKDGKFYLNSTEAYTPTENVWYNIKVVTDGSTASVYVNGASKATGVAATGAMTSVAFNNTSGKQIMIDDVQVYKTFNYDYADYPTLNDSDIANAKTNAGNLDLGMVSYPMWREGIHYGWDLITPYENERTPYLGWYSGGTPEVADWNIKWWAEHGFDHVIYPFVRPNINAGGGQPSFSVRGEELHDGYMNAKYNDKVDFAIMLTNPLKSQFTDAEGNVTDAQEWIDNVLPYLTETYFKKDNYKKINNQLVVYNYNLPEFAKCLTITETTGEGDEATTTVVRDGKAEVVKILKALNDKAKTLVNPETGENYAGVMFVMDISGMDSNEINTYTSTIGSNVNTLYNWRYTWGTDVGSNVSGGIENEYSSSNKIVASIPMGFNATPWQGSQTGFMDVSEVEDICNTVKTYRTANDPSIVLFTCWDEWGEGHFYSPASIHGFDYLNAARRILTDKGEALSSEEVPTTDAVKRMGVLYPEGRQALKIREDQHEAIDPAVFTNSLGTLTPSRSTYEDRGGCSVSYDRKTYTVTEANQASVWFKAPSGIDYSKVTAIKVRGYAENSATLVVKYGNDSSNPFSDSVNPESVANRYRFECANEPGSTTKDYILLPNYPDKIAGAANETIKYIRFNPITNTIKGSKFYIESITFYMDDVPGFNVTVDGEKKTMTSTGSKYRLADTMLPAYKLLLDIGAKVTWNKSQKILKATKNGVTAVYEHDKRNVVDAADTSTILVTAPTAASYQDGNLFVSYDALLKPFGYTVEYDSTTEDIKYYSAQYFNEYDATDYKWDFNKDGDREGWAPVLGDSSRNFVEGNGTALTVKDGIMHVRSAGTDASIYYTFDTPVDKEIAKTFIMKINTSAPSFNIRIYGETKYTSGAGITYVINPANFPTGEVELDLSDAEETPPRENTMIWNDLDNVKTIRIDPMPGYAGSTEIDYIQLGHIDPFKFKAYSFGENLFDLDNINWTYRNGIVLNSESPADAWGYNDGGPLESTDGEDVVLQLKFTEGSNAILAGFNYMQRTKLIDLLKDKQVKLSFTYKTDADVTSFKFENRHGDKGTDGETIILTPTSEWTHVESYLDMTKVYDESGARVYQFRVTRTGTTGDCSAYIKDMQIRVLDESTEVGYFTESGVALKLINNTGEEIANTVKVHVGAFDTVNKELNNFTSGAGVGDEFYGISPTEATDEIRAYLWDGLNPLIEPYALQKKATNNTK